MSSRVVKWLFLASLFLLVFPVAAGASTARVEGMAIQGDYIKDYTGIYTYLSNVCCVGNLVYGELGNTVSLVGTDLESDEPASVDFSDRGMGAVLGNLWDGRYGTWAIHIRELTPQFGQGSATSSTGPGFVGGDPNTNTNQSFDLMWGKKFGTTSIGLDFNRSSGRVEMGALDLKSDVFNFDKFVAFDLTDPNFSRNVLGFGGGLGFEMTPKATLEASFLYQTRTFEWTEGALGYKDDGPTTYQVAARAFWQWQPNVVVVPVFKYYSFDLSTKGDSLFLVNNPGELVDASLKGWQAGLAGNWTLGSNDLFVLGLTFANNKVESTPKGGTTSTLTEAIQPQVFAALETQVNSWLTLRMGANKGVLYSWKEESGGTTDLKSSGSPFTMSLGAGIKLSTLQVDATLSQDFPHNMPYLISGSETSNMFPKVSATYSF
jgi:hypothetical protein